MSDDVLGREEMADLLADLDPLQRSSGVARRIMDHDAALRERVGELEEALGEIVTDYEEHGNVNEVLIDAARQALEAQSDRE